MNEVKIGSYVGNGAVQNIECGFVPDYVRIVNATDGDQCAEWFAGMADGSSISVLAAAGPVLDTTNQVSDYEGSTTAAKGFTVGTDLSEAGDSFRYVALRQGS